MGRIVQNKEPQKPHHVAAQKAFAANEGDREVVLRIDPSHPNPAKRRILEINHSPLSKKKSLSTDSAPLLLTKTKTSLDIEQRKAQLRESRTQRNQVGRELRVHMPLSGYNAERTERFEDVETDRDITSAYPTKPIQTLIPMLLRAHKRNGEQRKLKILDVSAGTAEYSQDIRDAFGDEVKVYSTGLSKRTANNQRRMRDAQREKKIGKLHKDDLKWVSIEDVQHKFDLIMSSFGEILYTSKANPLKPGIEKENYDTLKHKLGHVLRCLNDGGVATISPVRNKRGFKKALTALSKEEGITIDLIERKLNTSSLFSGSDVQMILRKNAEFQRHQTPNSFTIA